LPAFIVSHSGMSAVGASARTDSLLDNVLLQTTSRFRASPWMWFALAQSLQRPGERCAPARDIRLERWLSHCRRVFGALNEAVRLDSAFVPALLELDA